MEMQERDPLTEGLELSTDLTNPVDMSDVKMYEFDHFFLAIAKAKDVRTGNSRYGACEQYKVADGRRTPVDSVKLIHMAQRRAIEKLFA